MERGLMLEKAVFFRAESNAKALPQSMAEVILSGRSNVGKSSVINALCSKRDLARTSKTPGRTRSINVYSVAMKKWIIDLPGYGFARVSLKEKELWSKMIEECIVRRNSKKRVYVVIDALTGPTELDFDMVDWLGEHGVPFRIVVNKCDKVPNNVTREDVRNKVVDWFDVDKSYVFPLSTKAGQGFGDIQADIVKFLDL